MSTIRIKFIKDEDFVNYKKPAMFIGMGFCDFKCCIENNLPISTCQNAEWMHIPLTTIDNDDVIDRFLDNPLTEAIVFGGLEPFLQIEEVLQFIFELREEYESNADVVIYTGYTEEEVKTLFKSHYDELKDHPNVIIKYGRFVPNQEPHYDEVLGVKLASDNQYAKRIVASDDDGEWE